MSRDNPDTISMEESQSDWQATLVEDVFLPSVRVQLAWRDVEDAVAHGAIVPAEAHSLWATWAMPGAPTRVVNAPMPMAYAANAADDPRDSGFASDSVFADTRQGGESMLRQMPELRPASQAGGALAGAIWGVAGLVVGAGLVWLMLG